MSDVLNQVLEHRILNGLVSEWNNVQEFFSYSHRNEMIATIRQPGFLLKDMQPLGQWNREEKVISMNREFVLTHPWDAVVDVLLHEIAHQIVDQILDSPPEPPHGPAFHQACRMIRANPRSTAEYQSLHDYIRSGKASEADKILEKVNKLLALAQSPSEHEAREAMRKAHALMRSFNLDCLERRTRRDFFSMFLGKPAIRHYPEAAWLGCLLREYYFVETIWVTTYVLEKGRMGRVLEISGTSENLAMAEYVYSFVNHFIEQAWGEYRCLRKVSGRRRQTDFAVGVIKGFRESLAKEEREKLPVGQSSALVLSRDSDLRSYFRFRHPRIRSNSGSSRQIDRETVEAGQEIGRKLKIHRGIKETASGPVRLLQ
ncbi:MAG: DUF2786 domain-containing protein [Candidatus Riflebacteria bacterium]|nr:DUF2786 domain-containing protein [Candidatus Riflebacteria bacterium]